MGLGPQMIWARLFLILSLSVLGMGFPFLQQTDILHMVGNVATAGCLPYILLTPWISGNGAGMVPEGLLVSESL